MTNESEILISIINISYLIFYGHNESLFGVGPATLSGVLKMRNEITGNAFALCKTRDFVRLCVFIDFLSFEVYKLNQREKGFSYLCFIYILDCACILRTVVDCFQHLVLSIVVLGRYFLLLAKFAASFDILAVFVA